MFTVLVPGTDRADHAIGRRLGDVETRCTAHVVGLLYLINLQIA